MSSVLKAPSSTVPTIGYLLLTSAGPQGGSHLTFGGPYHGLMFLSLPFTKKRKKKKELEKKKSLLKLFPSPLPHL